MALKALGAVWDWAGRADDIYGRLLILVSTAAVVGGGFLLLLRVVGVVDTLLAIIGGLAILLGGFFLVAYTTNAYAASSTFRSDTSSDEQPDVEPKVASAEQPRSGPRWEEAGELAAQSTKTEKGVDGL